MYTAPVPVDQLTGSMVKHYQIEQLLGRGDVSIVYLASQQSQQQPVMLTLFRLPFMYDEQACERFVSRFSQIVSRLMQLGNSGTNKNPQKTPTAAVRPKGKVIGSQNLAVNSAQKFTNPADGNASLLIHLPNGNFAAYESACTHEGVQVNYNPTTHMLVCPRHGAIFDPARNGAIVKGPATRKLLTVTIYVNADGTISAG
ncbi:MAG: Rieske 2Fe-2S domain-containing protein [Ktedonobacteraceae bacterium]|nr:Rieske 2Fe-2S domain-containing protein [Ktedonobacteraceae bacterium]